MPPPTALYSSLGSQGETEANAKHFVRPHVQLTELKLKHKAFRADGQNLYPSCFLALRNSAWARRRLVGFSSFGNESRKQLFRVLSVKTREHVVW